MSTPMPPPPAYGMPPPMAKPQGPFPVVGGILLLVAGIISASFWGAVIAVGGTLAGLIPVGGSIVASIIVVCGAIGIIFSLIAILGGIMAFQRKMWGLAILGSILGLLTIGWYGAGSILSLVALILIAISKQEFQ